LTRANVRFGPKADIREIDLREHDQAVAIAAGLRDLRRFTHQTRRSLCLLSAFFLATSLCALSNHRRPYEFFERDIPIRMGHCRRFE
jgi:hypothetical protein